MVTDPLADFINQLKNAGAVGKKEVTLPYSSLKSAVATLLHEKGYVGEVQTHGEKAEKKLVVGLLYTEDDRPRIGEIKRVSKPARRLYLKAGEITPVKYGRGMLVLTTSKGILSDEDARSEGVGGEPLFSIW